MYILNDVPLPAATKARLVGDRLRPFLLAREASARKVVVDVIVGAVISSHKPHLVAAMQAVP